MMDAPVEVKSEERDIIMSLIDGVTVDLPRGMERPNLSRSCSFWNFFRDAPSTFHLCPYEESIVRAARSLDRRIMRRGRRYCFRFCFRQEAGDIVQALNGGKVIATGLTAALTTLTEMFLRLCDMGALPRPTQIRDAIQAQRAEDEAKKLANYENDKHQKRLSHEARACRMRELRRVLPAPGREIVNERVRLSLDRRADINLSGGGTMQIQSTPDGYKIVAIRCADGTARSLTLEELSGIVAALNLSQIQKGAA